ncbi:MAG TPA: DUF2800 domain-containing protein [Actinobacteria bacterium]|nr:DUF2800 domain-containing protein [Actinomycetota bacterium]
MMLSYSSISTYQNCPLSYKFAYVDKLPRKKTPALSFGRAIHTALYDFYNVPTPNPPSFENILSSLQKKWSSAGYSSKAEEKTYQEYAEKVLKNFYDSNFEKFSLPIALEHKFSIELDVNLPSIKPCILTGIIDKVEKTESGSLEIIDYKTSRKLPSQSKIDQDLQLSIYYLAAKKIWSIEPEMLTFYFVVPGIKMSTARNDDDVIKTNRLIAKTAESINKENFEPTENALCPWCDFQAHCPFFKDKFEKEKPTEIEKIIDEYSELKEEIKIAKNHLSGLENLIYKYFEEKDLKRIFSEKNLITRTEIPNYDYDTNELKEILEPLGLWNEILQINIACLNQLLKNNSLGEEVKKSIESIRKLKNISYRLNSKRVDNRND